MIILFYNNFHEYKQVDLATDLTTLLATLPPILF